MKERVGKSTGKRSSLVTSIPRITTLAVTIVIVIICAIFTILSRNTISGLLDHQVDDVAHINALTAESYFESMDVYAAANASAVKSYKSLGQDAGQASIISLLKDTVSSGKVFSAYYAFEPNKFFPNTPDGLSYYAYQNGSGIGVDVLNDYTDYGGADYYAPTKESLKVHVTAPYSYTLSSGETVLLISLCAPIVDNNGEFLGVANCDIKVSDLQSLSYTTGDYTKAYSAILDPTGAYIMNTADASLAGTQDQTEGISDILAEATGSAVIKTIKNTFEDDKPAIANYNPITVEGTDLSLVSCFVVDQSEAYSSVYKMIMALVVIGIISVIVLALICIRVIRNSLAPLAPVMAMADKIRNFDLSDDGDYVFPNNELGDLASVFIKLSDNLKGIIADEDYTLSELASGNFTVQSRCEDNYVGATGEILNFIQTIRERLGKTLLQISGSADQVASNAAQISEGSQALAQGATEQASSIEELSSMINSINERIKKNAASAASAGQLSEQTSKSMEESKEHMIQLTEAMNNIASTSAKIQNVISVIDNIAFQTNILALNAAVEAARAGEAGKGFAVVAEEVRNLAQQSADAAKSTESLITTSVNAVEKGKDIAAQTADSLNQVSVKVSEANDMVINIAAATKEQATAVEQITVGIDQISTVIQVNSATAQESAASSHELSAQAQKLKDLVGGFTLPTEQNQGEISESPVIPAISDGSEDEDGEEQ